MAPAEGACAPLNPAFVAQMEALLGAEAPAFCAALEAPAALALRVNPARPAAGELRPLFARDPVPWAENGYYLLPGARPGAGLSHFCGAFYVQEASAMLPAALLDVRPGQRVLDLCAAPGGKSSQLAAALGGEGLLISNEPEPKRAKVLAGNLERLGVPNAIVVNEYPEKLARKWPGFFDAVLVDAPCSGEGMFRREPDSRAQWQPNSPAGCAKRQAGILDRAAELLRPGGRLVYSTCTYNTAENEETVAAFLARHPEFSPGDFSVPGLSSIAPGQWKIYPHRVRGDGQFAALLLKAPGPAPALRPPAPEKAALALWKEFTAQFGFPGPGVPRMWGEFLTLLPEDTPDLSGVRVVQPGLILAQARGRRLEPAHALAMALDSLPGAELSDEAALAFARGEAVPWEGRGYLVARWRGMPLGWGKASDGLLKNHLPKGLRRANLEKF